MARVPAATAGVTFEALPPLGIVPEMAHAAVRFAAVRLKDADILPGDGYLEAVKPFRTIEDLHVTAAFLAWLFGVGRRSGWPEGLLESFFVLIAAARDLARQPPLRPGAHIALGGLLARFRRFRPQAVQVFPFTDRSIRRSGPTVRRATGHTCMRVRSEGAVKIFKNKGFFLVSPFLILSDVVFVILNYRASSQALETDVADWAMQSEQVFRISLANKATSMQQLATFVAHDPRVGALFVEAGEAVRAEGGGPGGPGAAAIRAELYDLVGPSWEKMTGRYDVRQLHFHPGPGSTSFLRVHRPDKFGDQLDDVRFTVVDANRDHLPVQGFETGRVYSGIRGVVPVRFDARGDGKMVHVGAVEAGTSFAAMIETLGAEIGCDVGVLLTEAHVRKNMWPDFIRGHFRPEDHPSGCFIEASTDDAIRALLAQPAFAGLVAAGGAGLIEGRTPIQACAFALRDYRGTVDPGLPDSGKVVIWKDATEKWQAFRTTLFHNIIYAVLALIVVELMLFFTWGYSQSRLVAVIDEKTREIRESHRRLAALIDALPVGILVVRRLSDRIIDVNPRAAAMIGQGKDGIIGQSRADYLNASPDEAGAEHRLRTRTGDELPVFKTEIDVQIHGDAVTILSLADMTEHKQAERERLEREKLQSVLETAGAVCHELNQPLMILSGLAELLPMRTLDPQKLEKSIRDIQGQVTRMGGITRKIMNVTRYRTKDYPDGRIIDLDDAAGHSDGGPRS